MQIVLVPLHTHTATQSELFSQFPLRLQTSPCPQPPSGYELVALTFSAAQTRRQLCEPTVEFFFSGFSFLEQGPLLTACIIPCFYYQHSPHPMEAPCSLLTSPRGFTTDITLWLPLSQNPSWDAILKLKHTVSLKRDNKNPNRAAPCASHCRFSVPLSIQGRAFASVGRGRTLVWICSYRVYRVRLCSSAASCHPLGVARQQLLPVLP